MRLSGTYISPAETRFYYLQSRYYDAEIERFLDADSYLSTGQSFLGYNAFAYCGNNPIIYEDSTGNAKGYSFGQEYDLGNKWYARFDRGKVGNSDHVHVYNKYGDEWVMNLDGSMSHENKSNEGDPPEKVLKK